MQYNVSNKTLERFAKTPSITCEESIVSVIHFTFGLVLSGKRTKEINEMGQKKQIK